MPHDLLPYRTALATLFAAGITMSVYFRSRAARADDGRPSGRPEGPVLLVALRLCGMLGMAAVVAFIVRPQLLSSTMVPVPGELRWAGVVVAMLGHAGIFWMMRHLGTNLTSSVRIRSNHTLVTGGPYRWIRHPLYSFGLLAFGGIALTTASWAVLVPFIGAYALLVIRTRTEEANLVDRFGDEYRRYMRRTGRFTPRLHRVAESRAAAGSERRARSRA